MSPSIALDSILVHPMLAGSTLVVQHGRVCAAFVIEAEGKLGEPRRIDLNPLTSAWRGGPVE